jgi:hypothetical protein
MIALTVAALVALGVAAIVVVARMILTIDRIQRERL